MSRRYVISLILFISMVGVVSANLSPGTNITTTTSSLSYVNPGNSHSGSGSSGGGGGGGGVSSDESYSNIAQAARIEKDWHFNQTTTYITPYDITEITVRSNQSVSDVTMLLNILKNGSTKPAPNGTIYKYFNVYLSSKKYTDVTIRFRVNSSVTGTIGLVNFNGTKWIDIPTEKSYFDRNYTYYQAKATIISPKFAITVKLLPPTPTPTPTISGIPKVMPTIATNITENATTEPISEESSPLSPWIIIIGVVVVLILVVAYFFTA